MLYPEELFGVVFDPEKYKGFHGATILTRPFIMKYRRPSVFFKMGMGLSLVVDTMYRFSLTLTL